MEGWVYLLQSRHFWSEQEHLIKISNAGKLLRFLMLKLKVQEALRDCGRPWKPGYLEGVQVLSMVV